MASLYSTSLKTDYLDASLNQPNRRLEFKLNPDTAYYSNLRLLGLGATCDTGASNINSTAGLYGLIQNISLFDGAVEIDRLTEARRFMAFRNLNNTNHDNLSLTCKLSKGKVGYELQSDGKISRSSNAEINQQMPQDGNGSDAVSAYLDLRKCLPILEQIPYLDTSLMPNLRVVIEFKNNSQIIVNSNRPVDTTEYHPVLAVDEILDPAVKQNLKNKFKGIAYNAIEHDVITIADQRTASAGLGAGVKQVQSVNQRVNGFDNKLCGRLLMIKALSDKSINNVANINQGIGDLDSRAMIGEKINFQLNGQKLLAGEGLNTPAKIASFLHDSFGDVNILTFCNRTSVGGDADGGARKKHFVGIPDDGTPATVSDDVGQYGYVGIDFAGRRVNQFQLDFERDIIRDASGGKLVNSAGLDVHLFMEVQKQLMVSGNSYTIKYV